MLRSADTVALAQTLSELSGDLVLVLDASGLILSVAMGEDTPASAGAANWPGRAWVDTVTPETRVKVGKMLQELASTGRARRRELNHPVRGGASVALAYRAIRLGPAGPCLAMGHHLAAQAALQQRLLRAQREAEARHWGS